MQLVPQALHTGRQPQGTHEDTVSYFVQQEIARLTTASMFSTQEWLQCGACIFITKQSSEMTRHKQAHHGHPKRGQAGVKVDHSNVTLTQADAAAIKDKITPENRQLTRRMRSSQAASSRRASHVNSFDVKPSEPQPSSSNKISSERSKPSSRSHPYRRLATKSDAVQESATFTPPEQASVFVWNTSSSEPSATGYPLPIYPNQPSPSPSPTNLWDYPYAYGLGGDEVQESAVLTPRQQISAFPWSLPPPSSTERLLPVHPTQPSSWPPPAPWDYSWASGLRGDEVQKSALFRLPGRTSALAQDSLSSSPPSTTSSEYSCTCKSGRHEVCTGCLTYCAGPHNIPIMSPSSQPIHSQSDTGINYDTDLDSSLPSPQFPDFSNYTFSL